MSNKLFVTLIIACICTAQSALLGQIRLPAPSPSTTVSQTVGTTKVTFEYSRPSVKGRKIFGELVPYGKVWRTGANKVPNLTIDKDIVLQGNKVAAGKYALVTIPGEKEWTVVLNSETEQWGVYEYNAAKDVLRFNVPAEQLKDNMEQFTIMIDKFSGSGAEIMLAWEKSAIHIKLDAPATGGRIEASPTSMVTQTVGLCKTTITYARPSVKGRKIFGDLVPYGQVWRTGANKVTNLVTSNDAIIGGQKVPAGTYGLLSIPGEKSWTIILSSDSEQWGAYSYDQKKDVVRFNVPTESTAANVEHFTIAFDRATNTSSDIVISWANTAVRIKMEHNPHELILEQIKTETAKADAKADVFATAAEYYRDQNLDINQAYAWADKVIETDKNWWSYYLRASIASKLGKCDVAVKDAQTALEGAKKDNDESYVRMSQKVIDTCK